MRSELEFVERIIGQAFADRFTVVAPALNNHQVG